MVQDGVEGIDLNPLVKTSMEHFDLNPIYNIQVDYWSQVHQTYIRCGTFDSEASETEFVAEDELTLNKQEKPCLILRFKNCTGNVIDLSENAHIVNKTEFAKSQVALSIDYGFKNQRSRTIAQAVDMVIRQRTISSGYFDFQIRRLVNPMTLEQSAKNIDMRHKIITGEDQHIEKKTLDDYYG